MLRYVAARSITKASSSGLKRTQRTEREELTLTGSQNIADWDWADWVRA
jgi:hypothetical protein